MKAFDNQSSHGAKVLCGRTLADKQHIQIAQAVKAMVDTGYRPPCLVVMLAGDNPASAVYVEAKQKACGKVGINSRILRYPKAISQAELVDVLVKLNHDAAVDGILIQLPLPVGLDANALLEILDPFKDVDGLTPYNLGCLLGGRPHFVPCTALGCLDLITQVMPDITGKKAVVFGRSLLVGKPVAILLEQSGATVTVVHSRSTDVPKICRQADIVVAAIGKPGLITADYIKPGAIVIDVGITRVGNNLVGDVHESVRYVAGWLTPVPGGVGPMTITKLLSNTVLMCQLSRQTNC